METIIHQSWKTSEIDEVMSEWTSSVKAAFPTWEYKFWTDEDNDRLIQDHYPEFLSHYKNKLNAIERADFSRYLYIHHCGGLYLDIDIKMNFGIDFGDEDVVLCDQTNEANADSWPRIMDPFCVGGRKGNPFFYNVCDNIVKGTIYRLLTKEFNLKYYSLYTTGPFLLTKFYLIYGKRYKIRVLKNVLTTTRCMTDDRPKDQFAGVHVQMSSWMAPKDRMH